MISETSKILLLEEGCAWTKAASLCIDGQLSNLELTGLTRNNAYASPWLLCYA
jgi:hypothetical protein